MEVLKTPKDLVLVLHHINPSYTSIAINKCDKPLKTSGAVVELAPKISPVTLPAALAPATSASPSFGVWRVIYVVDSSPLLPEVVVSWLGGCPSRGGGGHFF